MKPLRLLLIGCPVFQRELELLAVAARNAVTLRWLEIGLHERQPGALRDALQAAVDAAAPAEFDAVVLAYGVCNRGVVGLVAKALPVVIPRAHDCLGILLGSTRRYLDQLQSEPGTYFETAGWLEHSNLNGEIRQPAFTLGLASGLDRAALAEKYGEENADFLLEQLTGLTSHYRRLVFIDTQVPSVEKWAGIARNIAAKRDWRFERLTGDLGWLRRLLDGDWNEEEFMRLQPGERVAFLSDDQLIGAEPA
jgi:hypothetical protein